MIVLRALGALLSYPREDLRQARPEIAEAIRASPLIAKRERDGLMILIDDLASAALLPACVRLGTARRGSRPEPLPTLVPNPMASGLGTTPGGGSGALLGSPNRPGRLRGHSMALVPIALSAATILPPEATAPGLALCHRPLR